MPVNTTDEADIPHVVVHLGFLVSECSKSINNDTENDVEEHYDNDQEEGEIVEGSQIIDFLWIIKVRVWWKGVTYTSTSPETKVQSWNIAVEERPTNWVTFFDIVKLDIVVIVVVKEEGKQQNTIDPDQYQL